MRFEKKRGYNRPIVHLDRHGITKNMPDERILPVRLHTSAREMTLTESRSPESISRSKASPVRYSRRRKSSSDVITSRSISESGRSSPRATEPKSRISSIASPHAARAVAANSWTIGRLTESIQWSCCECTAIIIADRAVPGEQENSALPFQEKQRACAAGDRYPVWRDAHVAALQASRHMQSLTSPHPT